MFNKIFNKGSKASSSAPLQQSTSAATPAAKPTEALNREHATAGSASISKAEQFLTTVKGRRTIYALGKDKVISDKEITSLIQTAVREAPSSFNSQSSRVVILLGAEHDKYWSNVVTPALEEYVKDADSLKRQMDRVTGFAAGYGTVLFFEDEAVIKQFQENVAAYASLFPIWSNHSSGMAQVYTWNVLEAAGYGANLQHIGGSTAGVLESSAQEKYSLPSTWKLNAELVFGSVSSPAGEKQYMEDADRFKVFGAQ